MAIGQPLAGRTAINIVGGDIDEVLFAEATGSLGTRGHRLRQRHRDVGVLASLNLLAIVIAAVCHDIERLNAHLGSRLLGHIRQLMAVSADVRHLVGHNEMVLGVDRGLHIVADDPGVVAARRHRTRIRIRQRDLLILALHHLGIDRTEPLDLFPQFLDFLLEPHNPCLRHRITTAVSSLQLRYVARDALVNPLQTPLHLGLGEVLIARIDSLEFGTIDGDARLAQQIKLAAQRHEATADLTNRLAVVLAEIRNGLEVWCQLPRQPDQLDITLALTLKPAARRNPIEIAINVYLEQRRRMIARPPLCQRHKPTKAKLAKIKTFNKCVYRTNRIVLGYVVVKHCRKKCALAPVNPLHKA
jgi:hypothetical protein